MRGDFSGFRGRVPAQRGRAAGGSKGRPAARISMLVGNNDASVDSRVLNRFSIFFL
jgi:hypothetical protein